MSAPVGIDDLNLYASTLAVDFASIAASRGLPEKTLRNVGFVRRSLLPSYEDPVTLAVNAAKPLVEGEGAENFELLIVATETGVDFAKPLSSYVHDYLGLQPFCRNFEIKHACYAGTAALQMAASWVRSRVAPGKRALVIMTDMGRRHFHELSELSLGCGAIAVVVAEEPRVLELEAESGYASREVFDTARPTATTEWIDAGLSLGSYLDLVEMAWESYRRAAGSPSFEKHLDYVIYHTPVVSLVKQAHHLLMEENGDDIDYDELAADFESRVEPSLRYNREVGNIYSGSLYVALIGLIESVSNLEPGTRIGSFSYGSGSCAEFFSGRVRNGARALVAAKRIGEQLSRRRLLSVEEYEAAVLAVEQGLVEPEFEPDLDEPAGHYQENYQGKGLLVLDRVSNHHRRYRWS